MKAGLFYADRLTTVSPTNAAEIQTPRYGANFDGLLRTRAGVLTGILNGVDPEVWNPATDTSLPQGRMGSTMPRPGGRWPRRRCSGGSVSPRIQRRRYSRRLPG